MVYIYTPAEHKTTHLNFIDEPLGSALHPLCLLGLGDLLVAGPVIPALAPYINVLATVMGTPLNFLHFVIGDRLGLLALCATTSHGNGYHRTLTPARGALQRGSLRWGWSWGPLFFSQRRGRDLVFLLQCAGRGRCPCGLIAPCRGTRLGLVLGRVLLGDLRRSHNGGVLHGLLADGKLCGIMIGSCWLGCPRARNIARINIRGSTTKKNQFKLPYRHQTSQKGRAKRHFS